MSDFSRRSRFADIENAYLQVLAHLVPPIDGHAGFFAIADSRCQGLRFIPRLGFDLSPKSTLDAYHRAILEHWHASCGDRRGGGRSLHQLVREAALRARACPDSYELACQFLATRAHMPLAGSVFEQTVLHGRMQGPSFSTPDYPDLISESHRCSAAFEDETIPVLISEYLVGMGAGGSPVGEHVHVLWWPMHAFGQRRATAVWFWFSDALDLDLPDVPLPQGAMDIMLSTAIVDILVARLLDSLEVVSALPVSFHIYEAFSELYLCSEIELVDSKRGCVIGKACRDSLGDWQDLSARREIGEPFTGPKYVIRIAEDVGLFLGFDQLNFRPAFGDCHGPSITELSPSLSCLLNEQLRSAVVLAEHKRRAAAYEVEQIYSRHLNHNVRNLAQVIVSLKNGIKEDWRGLYDRARHKADLACRSASSRASKTSSHFGSLDDLASAIRSLNGDAVAVKVVVRDERAPPVPDTNIDVALIVSAVAELVRNVSKRGTDFPLANIEIQATATEIQISVTNLARDPEDIESIRRMELRRDVPGADEGLGMYITQLTVRDILQGRISWQTSGQMVTVSMVIPQGQR